MADVEFVNREVAEIEAARGISLLTTAEAAETEAWFAWQAVADLLGPTSNTGIRGVSYESHHKNAGRYALRASCVDGPVAANMVGPRQGEDFRTSPLLVKASEKLDALIAAAGGRMRHRQHGTSDGLLAAAMATPEGKAWAELRKEPGVLLLGMVRVADAYGRDGVYPPASLAAHHSFRNFDNRVELVRRYPTSEAARMRARQLGGGAHAPARTALPYVYIPRKRVVSLAIRTGSSEKDARMILRARLTGLSESQLLRLVRESSKVMRELEEARRPRTERVLLAA